MDDENIRYKNIISTVLELARSESIKLTSDIKIETYKGDRDFALNSDMELEKIIKNKIKELDPGIPILGEELGFDIKVNDMNSIYWVVDPIDGSINYSRKISLYGCAIALVKNGSAIASGITFPLLNQEYSAFYGYGAYLNGNRIYSSETRCLKDSIIGFGDFSVNDNFENKNRFKIKILEKLANKVLRVRMPGSAALQLAWVAAGNADISLTLSNNSWDVQAGVLLVRESGGLVFDSEGLDHTIESNYTMATNKYLKNDLLSLL